MNWSTPFIVYRIEADGTLKEVYHAKDLNAARYWLKYIAQPGDVCCRTPKHPKHATKTGTPEYFNHKDASGSTSDNEESWRQYAKSKNFAEFPSEERGIKEEEIASTL